MKLSALLLVVVAALGCSRASEASRSPRSMPGMLRSTSASCGVGTRRASCHSAGALPASSTCAPGSMAHTISLRPSRTRSWSSARITVVAVPAPERGAATDVIATAYRPRTDGAIVAGVKLVMPVP